MLGVDFVVEFQEYLVLNFPIFTSNSPGCFSVEMFIWNLNVYLESWKVPFQGY